MAKEGWYKLPGTEFHIPMPVSDLVIALVTVILFIPTVIIAHRIAVGVLGIGKRQKRD